MTLSSNSFSKDVPTKSGNSFSDDKPTVSANEFNKDADTLGSSAWEGENLTSGPPPGDSPYGSFPGVDESGGIAHFKNRTQTSISH